jgi:BolA protein
VSEERRARIEAKLRERLAAERVELEDESHLHAGHAGAASGAGHFRATIVSQRFVGLSRIAAQRLVYQALEDEMGDHIHALAMRTLTPDEDRTKPGPSHRKEHA